MRRQERVLEGPEKEARQDEKNKNTTGQLEGRQATTRQVEMKEERSRRGEK